jgi:hypothetical protein
MLTAAVKIRGLSTAQFGAGHEEVFKRNLGQSLGVSASSVNILRVTAVQRRALAFATKPLQRRLAAGGISIRYEIRNLQEKEAIRAEGKIRELAQQGAAVAGFVQSLQTGFDSARLSYDASELGAEFTLSIRAAEPGGERAQSWYDYAWVKGAAGAILGAIVLLLFWVWRYEQRGEGEKRRLSALHSMEQIKLRELQTLGGNLHETTTHAVYSTPPPVKGKDRVEGTPHNDLPFPSSPVQLAAIGATPLQFERMEQGLRDMESLLAGIREQQLSAMLSLPSTPSSSVAPSPSGAPSSALAHAALAPSSTALAPSSAALLSRVPVQRDGHHFSPPLTQPGLRAHHGHMPSGLQAHHAHAHTPSLQSSWM